MQDLNFTFYLKCIYIFAHKIVPGILRYRKTRMLRIYFCLFEKIKVDYGFLTLIYNEYSSKCQATRCHVTLHFKEYRN